MGRVGYTKSLRKNHALLIEIIEARGLGKTEKVGDKKEMRLEKMGVQIM